MNIRGSIDRLDSEFIKGWITCEEAPELKVILEVWLGNNLLGHVAADQFRPDLAQSDIGDGHCSFSFQLPTFIPDSQLNQLKLKLINSDIVWLPKNMPSVAAAPAAETAATPKPIRKPVDRPARLDRPTRSESARRQDFRRTQRRYIQILS